MLVIRFTPFGFPTLSSFPSACFLLQAQAFYERELEAMKRTQQLTADNLLAWKRTEAELRREFQTQEAALQKTLGKLRAELARVTDEARENREKSHKLQASLTTTESTIKVSADPGEPAPPSSQSRCPAKTGPYKNLGLHVLWYKTARIVLF